MIKTILKLKTIEDPHGHPFVSLNGLIEALEEHADEAMQQGAKTAALVLYEATSTLRKLRDSD